MGMFDTFRPCEKLQKVLTKELGMTDFDWQTKSWLNHLAIFGINEGLLLTLEKEGCYNAARNDTEIQRMLNGTFNEVDFPYVNDATIYLKFVNSKLTAVADLTDCAGWSTVNPFEGDGATLITFETLDNYKVEKVGHWTKEDDPVLKELNDIISSY